MSPPRVVAVATAVPEHVITQDDARRRIRRVFPGLGEHLDRLEPIYLNSPLTKSGDSDSLGR
jgi:hypothetical protein